MENNKQQSTQQPQSKIFRCVQNNNNGTADFESDDGERRTIPLSIFALRRQNNNNVPTFDNVPTPKTR